MGTHYEQLSAEERATMMLMAHEGQSLRAMARTLHRAPSTISREWRRHELSEDAAGTRGYDAKRAGQDARRCRFKPRRSPKLAVEGVLFGVVEHFLREGWSPGQIAGAMKMMWPDSPERRVCTETIYTCLYALPRGALRQELIAGLRKAHSARLPRSRGTDRRGQLPDMLSIHVRPPEVEDRALPGHWEGDFIKGAGNRSAVGVLVERSSRLVLLAKMDDATAASALTGYTRQLNSIAEPMRQSLTYDQGKEMARHAELTAQTGVKVSCCDPHSPWQRGSCENTNGLLRQYLPKGTDLSIYSQEELDAIAERLNQRPRAHPRLLSPDQRLSGHPGTSQPAQWVVH
jgi:IS30 family transposase